MREIANVIIMQLITRDIYIGNVYDIPGASVSYAVFKGVKQSSTNKLMPGVFLGTLAFFGDRVLFSANVQEQFLYCDPEFMEKLLRAFAWLGAGRGHE